METACNKSNKTEMVCEKGMRIRRMRRSILGTAMCVFLTVFMMLIPQVAYADWVDGVITLSQFKGGVTIYPNTYGGVDGDLIVKCPKASLKSVKSSNSKVLPVDAGGRFMILHYGRPGKATVTYTYAGKRYKTTVIAKKYAKPVSKVMVGKTNIASKFKSRGMASMKWSALRGKTLKVTPASGWTVKRMRISYWNAKNGEVTKTIKNGSRIPNVKTNWGSLEIVLMNKKAKGVQTINVYF